MDSRFKYEVIQVGAEEVQGKQNVITEIRFYHCLGETKKLYVAHILYDKGEKPITLEDINFSGKDILFSYIEESLGQEQIQHMEKVLLEETGQSEIKVTQKQYIDI